MIYIKYKLLFITFIGLFFISINTFANAKYISDEKIDVANLNIDRTKPKIQIISISNSNIGYEGYANKNHTIGVQVKFTDKNIKEILCNKDHIRFKINDNYIDINNVNFTKIKDETEEKVYQIVLKNIAENGMLKLEFIEGIIVDSGGLVNDRLEVNTQIVIDNIAPTGNFREELISSQGKIKGIVETNEAIRKMEGWNISNNNKKIEKEFTNNISYELPIIDFAGNKGNININITKATYINMIYASHNSEIGWSYGYGNYDIAGKEAIKRNPVYKTEALAFNISGNISKDFVQARAYVYTYWGPGTYGKCRDSGMIYGYGYNPSSTTYKSMQSNDLVTISGKKYFQFGGNGINAHMVTDINNRNPIPYDAEHKYPFGVCGISIKLKDYSYFSIVYQILVNGSGWIQTCSDGQECIKDKTRPMSACRVALVPKTEKQYLINAWNKDIGTYNLK